MDDIVNKLVILPYCPLWVFQMLFNCRFAVVVASLLMQETMFAPAPVFGQTAGKEFVELFDGKSLKGWRARPHLDPRKEAAFTDAERKEKQEEWTKILEQHWSVDRENGEIVSDGHGVFLTTEKEYGDFEFHVDWKMIQPNGDSGIYVRGCPQIQIWDPNNKDAHKHGANKGSGALWNNGKDHPGKWPLVLADKPVGQWNTFRIRMIGSRVWVWFNDQLTVDAAVMDNFFDRSIPVFARGVIQLQTHGSETRFRNLRVREIGTEEANNIVTKITDTPPSLIGHWSFDENYLDRSPGKHHGKVVGEPVKFIDGKHGQAVEFHGASAIHCGNVPLGETGQITVAFWAKPTRPERIFGGIVQKQNKKYSERSFWIGAHLHGIMWAYFSPSTAKGRPLTAPNTIKKGEWVHVAMTFDGQHQKTYINGKLEITGEQRSAAFVDGGNIFRFGRVENAKGGYYYGGLDDVWVFSKALVAENIVQLMQGKELSLSEN